MSTDTEAAATVRRLRVDDPVCYIGINPNTSKPKGIAFNA